MDDSPETIIKNKIEQAVDELKSFCTNDKILNTIDAAVKKTVLDILERDVAKAKTNAGKIIKKIKALNKKYEIGNEQLTKLYDRIRALEDQGKDIMKPMELHIAAENALKNFNYPTFKENYNEAQQQVERIEGAEGTEADAEPAAEAEPAAAEPLTAETDELIDEDGNPIPPYNPFDNVQDIRAFVKCKVCGETLGDRPIVKCSECGKRYHTDCASTIDACLICQTELEKAPIVALPTYEGITDEPPEADTIADEFEQFMKWYDKWASVVFG